MVGNAKRWSIYGLARNVALARLLENFLVAAVASMLAIRFYLTLTGFPQLGGAGLHIAHLLWGGLFMLVALVLLLAFLGRRVKYVAAVLGGIGFGTFIDELGKFITSDNNYFFKPTVAIVYIVFVLLFALSWLLERPRFSQRERIANALDEVKEVVLRGGDPTEVSEVVRMVHAAGPTPDPLLLAVAEAVERVQPTTAPPKLGAFARFAARCEALYRRVVASRPFQAVLIVAFLAYVIAAAGLLAVEAVTRAASAVVHAVAPDFFQEITGAGTSLFVLRALFVSFALSAALAAIGLVSLRRSRLSAHRWFKRSNLVSIFLVQVFLFYSQQLEAITGLTVNLVALVAPQYHHRRRAPHPAARDVDGRSTRIELLHAHIRSPTRHAVRHGSNGVTGGSLCGTLEFDSCERAQIPWTRNTSHSWRRRMRAASRSISTFLCPVTPTPISLTIEVTPQTKTPQTLDALYGALSDTPMPEIAIDPLP